jgi:hypothetical protein
MVPCRSGKYVTRARPRRRSQRDALVEGGGPGQRDPDDQGRAIVAVAALGARLTRRRSSAAGPGVRRWPRRDRRCGSAIRRRGAASRTGRSPANPTTTVATFRSSPCSRLADLDLPGPAANTTPPRSAPTARFCPLPPRPAPDLRALGDLGYEGDSGTITVAFKKPKNGRLTLAQQQLNKAHNSLRAIDERGNYLLKITFEARSPERSGRQAPLILHSRITLVEKSQLTSTRCTAGHRHIISAPR